MKLDVILSTRFRRDYKRIKSRGYDLDLLDNVVSMLSAHKPLPQANRDHSLTGSWKGFRECHIAPDWLLIYWIREKSWN